MKTYVSIFIVICFATVIYGMIVMPQGYQDASVTFEGFQNEPRADVERKISFMLPNVPFKIYSEQNYSIYSEEFFFGKVRLVLNDNGNVVLPPRFFGIMPNLTFAGGLLGKDNKTAVQTIQEHIPSIKIVVQTDGCRIVWQSTEKMEDYILVQVSPEGSKVTKEPTYVRVPKNY